MLVYVQCQYGSDQCDELVSKCELLHKENSFILDFWTCQVLIVVHLWSLHTKVVMLILS